VPFLVVVRLHEQSSYTLKTFILRHWKARIGSASKSEVEEIEIFLEDLRLQSGEPGGIASLFQRLADLNVGPIRAFVSGSCSEQDLNEVIAEFFGKLAGPRPGKSTSPASFRHSRIGMCLKCRQMEGGRLSALHTGFQKPNSR
jgi:hypothetical protein